jgi:hypothetical protein
MPTLTEFFSMIGLGPSRQQLQKNEEIKKLGLSDAVEMGVITGGKRRHSKRKASKRKASKRKCKASRRK